MVHLSFAKRKNVNFQRHFTCSKTVKTEGRNKMEVTIRNKRQVLHSICWCHLLDFFSHTKMYLKNKTSTDDLSPSNKTLLHL